MQLSMLTKYIKYNSIDFIGDENMKIFAAEDGVLELGGTMEKKGLYGKYKIEKANGEAVDPNAVYFTLRIDTDQHARAAIRAYIESCKHEQPELAEDLERVLQTVE